MIEKLRDIIRVNGGFANCHSHLDRSNTIYRSDFSKTKNHLFEKWKIVDDIKRESSVTKILNNINESLSSQKKFGVSKIISFIDIDSVVGTKAIDAAEMAKEFAKEIGIDLKIACQTLKGVVSKEERSLFYSNIERFDIIGGLPKADNDSEKHIDILFDVAKQTGKKVHVHVDQLNTKKEKETELLALKTIKYGLEGSVVAVHSISLACHEKKYRNYVYKLCKDSGMSFIACPSAWIDSPRTEELSVTHNATTPIDELIKNNIPVALGSDNIHDIYKPYSDGDMMFELRLALESNKVYDLKDIVNIACNNYKYIA